MPKGLQLPLVEVSRNKILLGCGFHRFHDERLYVIYLLLQHELHFFFVLLLSVLENRRIAVEERWLRNLFLLLLIRQLNTLIFNNFLLNLVLLSVLALDRINVKVAHGCAQFLRVKLLAELDITVDFEHFFVLWLYNNIYFWSHIGCSTYLRGEASQVWNINCCFVHVMNHLFGVMVSVTVELFVNVLLSFDCRWGFARHHWFVLRSSLRACKVFHDLFLVLKF